MNMKKENTPPESELDRFAQMVLGGFQEIHKRFDGVDKRFDGIDIRLDGIDERLDKMDARFDETESNTNGRFNVLEAEIDGRFSRMTEQISRVQYTLDGTLDEIKYIKKRLDSLEERIGSQESPYKDDIQDLRSRLAIVEQKVSVIT